MFTSSTKCEIRQFQVVVFDSTHLLKTSNLIAVVVQRGKRNVEKSVIHVQSYCSASLNQLLFAVLVAVAGIPRGIYIDRRPNYSVPVSFPAALFRLPVEFIQHRKKITDSHFWIF